MLSFKFILKINFTSCYPCVETVWVPGRTSTKLTCMSITRCKIMISPANHSQAIRAFGLLHGSTAVCNYIKVTIRALVPVSTAKPDGFDYLTQFIIEHILLTEFFLQSFNAFSVLFFNNLSLYSLFEAILDFLLIVILNDGAHMVKHSLCKSE